MVANETKAVIIGLGQIGGSLALALKRAGFFESVGGYDIHAQRLQKAGAFLDVDSSDLDGAISAVDLVILAAPILENIRILKFGIKNYPDKLYTDVGSTKRQILEASGKAPEVRFIGGHPFTGTEKEGESGWDESLFRQKTYFWVPEANQAPDDVELLIGMIEAIGAIPKPVTAEEHDQVLALTSHLPILVSLGLTGLIQEGGINADDFVGSGFLSAARLAGGSPEMGKDILLSNREAVLDELIRFINELSALVANLREPDGEELLQMMKEYQQIYRGLLTKSNGNGQP